MPSLRLPVIPAGRLARTAQPVVPVDAELELRPWVEADAGAVIAAYADPAIRQWHARTVDDEAEALGIIEAWQGMWAEETGAAWAVAARADGAVLGRMSLRDLSLTEGLAEIGYWTLPPARGRRVASRALTAAVAWAFDDLGLHRLRLLHAVRNEASCRVAERCGFRAEGTERSSLLHQDGWHDMHLHGRVSTRMA